MTTREATSEKVEEKMPGRGRELASTQETLACSIKREQGKDKTHLYEEMKGPPVSAPKQA